jgi:hypothetical protein
MIGNRSAAGMPSTSRPMPHDEHPTDRTEVGLAVTRGYISMALCLLDFGQPDNWSSVPRSPVSQIVKSVVNEQKRPFHNDGKCL